MNNAIHTLRIQNFKSIKDVELKPRRVNIIIGEPNVGKSNVLEAISLLGGMFFDGESKRFMEGQIRYENIRNLFYDNDWLQEVAVIGEGIGATRLKKIAEQVIAAFGDGEIRHRKEKSLQDRHDAQQKNRHRGDTHPLVDFAERNQWQALLTKEGFTSHLTTSQPLPSAHVKKYHFQRQAPVNNTYVESYLRAPLGDNLLEVIATAPSSLKRFIGGFFTSFGLNLAQRPEELEVQKNVEGIITSIPYSLIADTLQRLIFYLAAIESNDDAVLLFEEPEAHSFPTYVSELGQRIVDSRNNQFFIVTHSPYLVTEILEEMLTKDELKLELAIFAAYYEDYQTKVRQLSDEQIANIRRDGLDVFYNMARFVPQH